MRAPDGRGFVRDGVGEQLRAGRKTDDILQRRLDRQPRIPEAAGGIVGVTRCTPTSYGSYFLPGEFGWGTLYASGHSWTTEGLGGTAPAVTFQDAGADTSDGLDSVVVTDAGWYSFSLQFYLTANSGAYQPTAAYGAVVPESATGYAPHEATFPFMLGAIPGDVPYHSGYKRAVGTVATRPMLLAAGAVVGLRVTWDASVALQPNMDDRPRGFVDVIQYG